MMEFKTFLNFISLKSTLMNRNSHKNSLFIYSMKFLNELKKTYDWQSVQIAVFVLKLMIIC